MTAKKLSLCTFSEWINENLQSDHILYMIEKFYLGAVQGKIISIFSYQHNMTDKRISFWYRQSEC